MTNQDKQSIVPETARIATVVKDLIETLMLWNGQASAGLDVKFLAGLRDELAEDNSPVSVNHELKTDPAVFEAVLDGSKTHEIRFNDRNFQVGDILRLRETRYTGQEMKGPEPRPLEFTGRELVRKVSHVLEGYGLQPGWVILSLAATQEQEPYGVLVAYKNMPNAVQDFIPMQLYKNFKWGDEYSKVKVYDKPTGIK